MSSALSLLQLAEGFKSFGTQVIFDAATFAINEGEHVGVIGPNGAGKTTLFKILLGQEELDRGQIIKSRALRLGYLSQHDHWDATETGDSYLEKNCTLPVWKAKEMAQDLQISDEIFSRPLLSLSGGYRMRIKLVGLLGRDPNLMLLDEPTNYLDLETTLLLEKFLQSYQGAFLLISHDREILRRTTDHTLEVEGGEIIKYNGNIDDYFEQKELLRSQLEAAAQNQALKRKTVMDFVNRFGAKATKAKQAQSKLRSLDKMEAIEFKPVPISAVIKIPPPENVGKSVLRLEKADFGYSDRKIIKNVNIEIKRGDHVAVVGMNGVGKSTLLKGLAGTLQPQQGERVLGYQVEVAIFNQHVIEILNPEHSVFESLEDKASLSVKSQEIRNMAGSLLFSADAIDKKIKVLSGGEKSRVALGRVLLQRAPCLLLDEPTNHLDFQTVEALTQALMNYEGTFIVVSHDRGFVRRVGTKILEVSAGQVHLYPGHYDEYVWSLQKSLARQAAESPVNASVTVEASEAEFKNHASAQSKLGFKEASKKLRQLEKEVAQIEAQIAKLDSENALANKSIANGEVQGSQLNETIQLMTDNSSKIADHENTWVTLNEELGELRAQLAK